jgi:hypothetical protein
MLIPLTRQQLEILIPTVATGVQYQYCWGKVPDFLRRLLISVMGGVIVLILNRVFEDFKLLNLLIGVAFGFYWLWAPVLWASLRNAKYRRYPYCGFWQGEVLDVYITEELIGTEETVNNKGELVVVKNRERRLNLEVGDETGFSTTLQVPLQRDHRLISRGQIAEMLMLSTFPDLSRIAKFSDVYLPNCRLWVSDYPYLRRDAFVDVRTKLNPAESRSTRTKMKKPSRRRSSSRRSR